MRQLHTPHLWLGVHDRLLTLGPRRATAELRLVHHRALGMGRLERAHLARDLLLEHLPPARGRDEPEERRRRVERARAELGVRLQADEERVPGHARARGGLELEHLHALPALVLADEAHPGRGEALDVRGVDLVPVPVTLPDLRRAAVELAHCRPRRLGVEDGRPEAETHGAAHVRLGDFRHEDDDGVFSLGVELGRRSTYRGSGK